MSESTVAIIGSGIAGTTLAYHLTRRGIDVTMFEVGESYTYPHIEQYEREVLNLSPEGGLRLADGLRGLEVRGDYRNAALLPREQLMVVGGMATRWSAWTPRFLPRDFRTRSAFGYGVDWPLSYDELEPYYGRAEALIGVSGSDEGNPHAGPRSTPYPLPPFEFGYDDHLLYDRLKENGIPLHAASQARVSRGYDGRPGCANFGVCGTCPIGARYSPNHHLALALATGRLTLRSSTAVRRINAERADGVTSLLYYPDNGPRSVEHRAKVVILAAGAIESARLLLLSRDGKHPDGLGNASGQVGKNLIFSHIYGGSLTYKEKLYGGRVGPRTAESYHLRDPQGGKHGGFFRVSFPSSAIDAYVYQGARGETRWGRDNLPRDLSLRSGRDVLPDMELTPRSRTISILTESVAGDGKYVALSATAHDRFGDPFALVVHQSDEFDHGNHDVAQELHQRFSSATHAVGGSLSTSFDSGHHHIGTLRMGSDPRTSVTDTFGRVHGLTNLFVAGASLLPSASAANPTLTLVALALRTTDYLLDHVLAAVP